MRNWRTTLFGFLAAVKPLTATLGLSFGHIGSVDIPTAISGLGTLLLGYYAKDFFVSGTGKAGER